jgi:uncharacterized delta-60 repeat protein
MFYSALLRRVFGLNRQPAKPIDARVEALEPRIALTAGVLDFTFSTDGVLAQDFGLGSTDDDGAEAVVIQPDGKILVAGFAQRATAGDFDIFVARYNRDGTPDTDFGIAGVRYISFDLGGTKEDRAQAIALQADGKIVVAGFAATTNGTDFAIARLDATGTLDPAFDGDGKTTVPFDLGGTNNDVATDLVIQPDGKIVVVGSAATAANGTDFAIVRLDTGGTPDGTFNTDGKLDFGINLGGTNNDVAEAVALSGDKIVLAGTAENSPTLSEAVVAVLTAAGNPDVAFAGGGVITLRYASVLGHHTAKDVAVQSDGGIVLTGQAENPTGADNNIGIARLTPAGVLDPTFDDDGRRALNLSNDGTREDAAETVIIQPDGKIFIAGFSARDQSGTVHSDWFGLRLNADGSPDTTYNGSGLRFYDLAEVGFSTDTARAAALGSDGFVIVGNQLTAASGTDTALARIRRDDWLVVAEAAKGSTISIFTYTGTPLYTFESFPAEFKGGVRVATADITGDGCPDFFVAPAKGGSPVVRIFDGFTFDLLREIPVLDPGYKGGVNIAVADVLDPTNAVELIVAPGKKFPPRVEIYDPLTVGVPLKTFDAYAATFKGGVRLAPIQAVIGGRLELAVGPASGRGAVKIFDVNLATPAELESVSPFGAKFNGGVFLSAANLDNDGAADLLIGSGKGVPKFKVFTPANDELVDEVSPFATRFTGGAQVSALRFDSFGGVFSAVSTKAGKPFIALVDVDTDETILTFQPFGPKSKIPISALLVAR